MPYVRLFVTDDDVELLRKVAKVQNAAAKEFGWKDRDRWTWRTAAGSALDMGLTDMWASGEYDEEEIVTE